MTARLDAIHLFPLKSCAPLAVAAADVEARGLAGDRRWMVLDGNGTFVTGRRQPRLTQVSAVADGDGLVLSAPGCPTLRIAAPPPTATRVDTRVWSSQVRPLLADPAAHAWISAFLGEPMQLVHMDAHCERAVDPDYAAAGDTVSFADGFPLLLLSQASVDALNARLAQPVSALRFRPNLVVANTPAHAEDAWRRVRIGAVEFDVIKPCTRCVFTTVDFERGTFDPSGEPLRTLLTYRRTPAGVTFGQNLIPRGSGRVHVGDDVEVVA